MKQVVSSSVVVSSVLREDVVEVKGRDAEVVSPARLTVGPISEDRPVLAKPVETPLAELRPVPWAFLHGLVRSSFPTPADQQVLDEQIDRLSVSTGCWLTQQMWRGYSRAESLPYLLRSFVSGTDPVKVAEKEASFSKLIDSYEIADVRDLDRAAMPGTLERLGITEGQLCGLNYRDRSWLSFFAVKGYFDRKSLTSLIERLAMIPDPQARMDCYHKIKYVISTPLDRLLEMDVLTMPQVQDLLHIYVVNGFQFEPGVCFEILLPSADRIRQLLATEQSDGVRALLSLIIGL